MEFLKMSYWGNMEFLNVSFWNNSVKEWLTALAIALAALVVLGLLKWGLVRYLANRAQNASWDVFEMAATMARRTKLTFVTIFSVYAGLQVLELPKRFSPWIFSIALIALILQLTLWANSLVDYYLNVSQRRKLEKNTARITTLRAAGFIVKLVLAVLATILILDNIPGVKITPLIASLGISGIAVALAVQNILSDLFASLSIVLDKPFVIDDFIIVDNYMGTVEHIGLKTTRLRSLSGEHLVFSNNDLLKSRIRNYTRMHERRVVFSIGVTYQTPLEKLKQIPATIRKIIESQEAVRFDRAHFQGYGDFALKFEVVYYVLNPDYNRYMDIQQSVNMAIFESFEKEGIDFAYPTQKLFIGGETAPSHTQTQAVEVP